MGTAWIGCGVKAEFDTKRRVVKFTEFWDAEMTYPVARRFLIETLGELNGHLREWLVSESNKRGSLVLKDKDKRGDVK
jgi:hypothetical protein